MSRFTSSTKNQNVVVNNEGAQAYSLGKEMELYTLVCTFGLSDKFYESADDQMDRLRTLIASVSPEFVAKLAVYAREKMYLRTVPVVLAVELAKVHTGSDLVSRMVSRIIQRADEITEVLGYYAKSNDRTDTKKLGKMSNQIKKGIRNVFESGKFNEYSFAKYNRDTDVKLRDALFLTHPKPQSDEMKSLFDKIASDSLEVPYTWETQLSEAGKNGKTKKEVWEELIDSGKVGYMALLRNLRNIIQAEVSPEHITKVCNKISDPESVRKSKQLPFRFLSAYRMLDSSSANPRGYAYNEEKSTLNRKYVGSVTEALEEAVIVSAENLPSFNDSVLATDVSGSMYAPISAKSVIKMYDIGSVLCMMAHLHSKNSVTGMFGDRWEVFNFPKKNILHNAQKIYDYEGRVGYSTNMHKVFDWASHQKENYDNFYFFTDMQAWDSTGGDRTTSDAWKKYKKRNPKAKVFFFDLQGYGNCPLNILSDDVYLIAGWSDKVFDVLENISNGMSALNVINQIEL